MALPNFSLPEGGSIVITPAGGSAITLTDPLTISPVELMRDKVQWKSITQTRKRNSTGSKEYGDVTVRAVYYEAEWDSLQSAYGSNKVCSTVVTKPVDVNATASSDETVTLTCQIQKLTWPEMNGESKQMEYEIVFVVDDVAFA